MSGARHALASLVACAPTLAVACPDCATADVVRASLWSAGVTSTVAAVLLPFAVVALAVAALSRCGGLLLAPRREPGASAFRR